MAASILSRRHQAGMACFELICPLWHLVHVHVQLGGQGIYAPLNAKGWPPAQHF